MHEYSIVQSLIEMCEDHAKENNSSKITKVTVKVGKLSGVEPHLLETAFDTFKESTICEEATLEMNIQNIIVMCKECEKESELQKNTFICPLCSSDNIKVIDGEEMYLMSLEMDSE